VKRRDQKLAILRQLGQESEPIALSELIDMSVSDLSSTNSFVNS